MKFSLARIYLLGAAAVLAVLAVATFFLYQFEIANRQADPANSFRERSIVSEVSRFNATLRETAQVIARHSLTLEALDEPIPGESAQAAQIRDFFPEAGSIELVPAGAGEEPPAVPLSGPKAELVDQLNRQLNPQGIAAAYLMYTVVEPVFDADRDLVGFVLLDRGMERLQSVLDQWHVAGTYVELDQVGAQHSRTILLRRGDEDLKRAQPSAVGLIPGTDWRVSIWSNGHVGTTIGLPQSLLLAGVLTLSLIGVFGYLYRRQRRLLESDMVVMNTLVSDLLHNRLRKNYRIQLKETQKSFDIMYNLAKLMLGKQRRVQRSAGIDHLSQVHNRRNFEAKQRELFSNIEEGWAHSILILDLDNFKRVNDTYGHEAGDVVIAKFGELLKKNLRSSDFVARLGGDEFCVIFPNTPLRRAAELTARLRMNVPAHIELRPGVQFELKWSGGLSEYSRKDKVENAALSRADAALLDAKRTGRNRTEIKAA